MMVKDVTTTTQTAVLLVNRLTTKAFSYLRLMHTASVDEDLISYVVIACLQNNSLSELLHMSCDEECRPVNILRSSPDCHCKDLLMEKTRLNPLLSALNNQKVGPATTDMTLSSVVLDKVKLSTSEPIVKSRVSLDL